MERITLTTPPAKGYELVDSGEEEKLERWGDVLLSRPDPQALWPKSLGTGEWAKAKGRYVREGNQGRWIGELPPEWSIEFEDLKFLIKPTSFKHTGLFPEQMPNWQWAGDLIQSAGRPASVLNLFGYTGGATLAAARAGARVVHVDASKTAVAWARENAALSNLADKPIRWITEDVRLFVERELKRGSRYDLILMDPPAFGHGPSDELWKIEEHLIPLIEACTQLLSDNPLGILLNGYAAGYSPLAFAYNLDPLVKNFDLPDQSGSIEYGDLTIEEKGSGRLLPCGIFARWKK
jgi:23S rRNA (cytosine1962-C5)-methyltransferase